MLDLAHQQFRGPMSRSLNQKDPFTLLAQSNPIPNPVNIFRRTGSLLHFIAERKKLSQKGTLTMQ